MRNKAGVFALILGLILFGSVNFLAAHDHNPGGPGALPPKKDPTVYEKILKAQAAGEISPKDAVLLKAKVLFAPGEYELPPALQPLAGEEYGGDFCLTGFYAEVQRVFSDLTAGEIRFLSSLDPNLDLLLRAWARGEVTRPEPLSASELQSLLDNYGLNQEKPGKYCMVHYTLDSGNVNRAKDLQYVDQVQQYMDKAIADMTRDFHAARAEFESTNNIMHVLIIQVNGPYGGGWKPTYIIKSSPGYITLSNDLDTPTMIKVACYHEYFHGITSYYNQYIDTWFQEACAVWAELYYGKTAIQYPVYFVSIQDSIFWEPNRPLWYPTYRIYSTGTLAWFFSDKYGGKKFFQAFLQQAESGGENDAIKIIQNVLQGLGASPFSYNYREFLAAMYCKSIKSLKKYMPDITVLQSEFNKYGTVPDQDTVKLTGAKYYRFLPEAGAKGTTLIAFCENKGALGLPEGCLITDRKTNSLKTFTQGRSYITNFVQKGAKQKEVVLIVTDAIYAGKDENDRTYEFSAIVPYVHINSFIPNPSVMVAGQTSYMPINYDLLGTWPDTPFETQITVTEKNPNVTDHVSGIHPLWPGVNQVLGTYFYTSCGVPPGTFKFTVQFAVPRDDWLIPQSKSQASCAVVVQPCTQGRPRAFQTQGAPALFSLGQ